MNLLFIPIYSMRSHKDGEYKMLADGNFQSALSRMLDLVKCGHTISCLFPTNASDINYLRQLISNVAIDFTPAIYGDNAMDTRERFWELNKYLIDETTEKYWDYVITDIEGFPFNVKFINNFNISRIQELERPYVDKFFPKQIISALKAERTIVINEVQRTGFLKVSNILESNPHKIVTNIKLLNPDIYKYFWKGIKFRTKSPDNLLFWPFRLTDNAYQFEWVYSYLIANHNQLPEGFEIVVTDPNNSLDKFEHIIRQNIIPVRKITPDKEGYYSSLATKPIMVMLDNIDLVLHPGLIEFLYFGCRIITLTNDTVKTNLQISNKLQLLGALNKASDPLFRLEVQNLDQFLINEGDTETFLLGMNKREINKELLY